jgi:RimJ/RimL family protein N-acetyltransferase
MNIEGKHVVLRAIEPSDLPSLQRWANDPGIQRMLGGWHFPTSYKDQQEWLAGLSCNSRDQRFAIETHELGLIGTANLVSIDWKNRNAFHGMLLGEADVRGKGLGVDTIMAIMRYAFDELDMARLDTDIIEYNQASLNAYVDKCGWIVEGRKANAYFRGGRYWEKVIVGITRERYQEIAGESGYWS